jgi:hypothetical protein
LGVVVQAAVACVQFILAMGGAAAKLKIRPYRLLLVQSLQLLLVLVV